MLMAAIAAVTFAQEEGLSAGLQAKNDGNAAFKEKNYVLAIEKWDIYLKSGEETVAEDANTKNLYQAAFKLAGDSFIKAKDFDKAYEYYEKYSKLEGVDAQSDGAFLFNYAQTASKKDKDDVALGLFQKCVELKYRDDIATLRIADIYRQAGENEKMSEILIQGLEKYPNSNARKNMIAMLTSPLLRQASVPFNEANELAKKASTNADQYVPIMENAVVKFKEAIPLFQDVLKYDPNNEKATTYIGVCNDNISAFETYKASLKK